jgi:hypothetical protein
MRELIRLALRAVMAATVCDGNSTVVMRQSRASFVRPKPHLREFLRVERKPGDPSSKKATAQKFHAGCRQIEAQPKTAVGKVCVFPVASALVGWSRLPGLVLLH